MYSYQYKFYHDTCCISNIQFTLIRCKSNIFSYGVALNMIEKNRNFSLQFLALYYCFHRLSFNLS